MHFAGDDLDLDPLPVGPRGRRGRPQKNDGLLLALVAGKVARWGCPVVVVLVSMAHCFKLFVVHRLTLHYFILTQFYLFTALTVVLL